MFAVGALISVVGGGSSSAADPRDIAAARACQEFVTLLGRAKTTGAIDGQPLLDAVSPLLAGSADARAANQPLPKWSDLGANLVTIAGDLNTGDYQKATDESSAIADECHSIPAAAQRAGGYGR